MTRTEAYRLAARLVVRGYIPSARAVVRRAEPGVIVIEVNQTAPIARAGWRP